MDSKTWSRLERLFNEAVSLSTDQRRLFIERVKREEPELITGLSRLLAMEEEDPSFLEKNIWECLDFDASQEPRLEIPEDVQRLPDYTIQGELGRGGMGRVFHARQERPIKRDVALKVLKMEEEDPIATARFVAEYNVLARMNHEHIARIFHAGSTPGGRPFFTMEHLDGQSITDYANAERLSIEARLKLFLQVCEGIGHAHRKRIIHRDLKPSNLMVVVEHEKPVAKIIDFGIAKSVDPKADGRKTVGEFAGTPQFMSPEQLNRGEVDTTTDIYGLGAVLYMLLTGHPPLEPDTVPRSPLPRLKQFQADWSPIKPSEFVLQRGLGRLATDFSVKRWSRRLCSDLDLIVLKSLNGKPDSRYPTAYDLARDITNFLEQRPVAARGEAKPYLFKCFLRRNAKAVMAGAAIFLALLAAATSAILGERKALHARDLTELARIEADRNAKEAVAAIDYLTEVLTSPWPRNQLRDIKMIDVLDFAASQLEPSFHNQPVALGLLHYMVGRTYSELSEYPKAITHFAKSYAVRRDHFGSDDLRSLEALERLAAMKTEMGAYEESERLFQRVLDVVCTGPLHHKALRGLADNNRRMGNDRQALPIYERLLAAQMETKGLDDHDVGRTLNGLVLCLRDAGENERALQLAEFAAIHETYREDIHPDKLALLHSLASLYHANGRFTEAEELHHYNSQLRRQVLGIEHGDRLDSAYGRARAMLARGNYRGAEAILREIGPVQERTLGKSHRDTLNAREMLGLAIKGGGDLAQAKALLMDVLAAKRVALGGNDPDTLVAVNNLGNLLILLGDPGAALPLLEEAVALQTQRAGAEHPNTLLMKCTLGECLLGLQRYEAAAELFKTILDQSTKRSDGNNIYPQLFKGYYGYSLYKAGQRTNGQALLTEAYQTLQNRGATQTAKLLKSYLDEINSEK